MNDNWETSWLPRSKSKIKILIEETHQPLHLMAVSARIWLQYLFIGKSKKKSFWLTRNSINLLPLTSSGGIQLPSLTAIIRKSPPSLALNLNTFPLNVAPFVFKISKIWVSYSFLLQFPINFFDERKTVTVSGDWRECLPWKV